MSEENDLSYDNRKMSHRSLHEPVPKRIKYETIAWSDGSTQDVMVLCDHAGNPNDCQHLASRRTELKKECEYHGDQ